MNISNITDTIFLTILPFSAMIVSVVETVVSAVLSHRMLREKNEEKGKKKVTISRNDEKNIVSISMENMSEKDIKEMMKRINRQIEEDEIPARH